MKKRIRDGLDLIATEILLGEMRVHELDELIVNFQSLRDKVLNQKKTKLELFSEGVN